jgi:hypothetical protein
MLVAIAGICGLATSSSAIATMSPCPDSLEALELQVPSYGRAGQSLPTAIIASNPQRVAKATLTTLEVEDETNTSLDISRYRTTAVISTPSVEPELTLILTWNQEEGTPAACRGFISYVIPVIPPFARAGTPLEPRLIGRFQVRETSIRPPRRKVVKPTWTFQPRCDYFACATRLRSTLSLRGVFKLLANGEYELLDTRRPRYACVERATQKVVARRAYREVLRVRIRVTKEPGVNQVHSFTGKIYTRYEATSRAQRKGCRPIGGYSVERVIGTRR